MGCFVTKATIQRYEKDLSTHESIILELKTTIAQKNQEIDLKFLESPESLGALAHQEQIRENFILTELNYLFQTGISKTISEVNYKNDLNSYITVKIQQTDEEKVILSKFTQIFEYIKKLCEKKKKNIKEDLQNLLENNNISPEACEKIMNELNKPPESLEKANSMEYLIESFLQMAELDTSLQMFQRKFEFKMFKEEEGEKIEKQQENLRKLDTLKNEANDYSRKRNDLRDLDVKIKSDQDSVIEQTGQIEAKIGNLNELIQKIEADLLDNNEIAAELDDVKFMLESKNNEITTLEDDLMMINREISEVKSELNLSDQQSRAKELKSKIKKLVSEIQNYKNLKNQIISERNKRRQSELLKKNSKVDQLKLNIKENQAKIEIVEKNTKSFMKKQVVRRIINNLKALRESAFYIWQLSIFANKYSLTDSEKEAITLKSSILVNTNYYNNAVPWESEQLYDFLNELMKEKYRNDTARIRNKKIPKAMDKYLKFYMKLIHKSTNETERELNMMIKRLLMEVKKNGIASIVKKLLNITNDYLPYHISYLITVAWIDFDQIKIISLDKNEAYILDVFSLIEEYIETSKIGAGQQIVYLIKPPTITNHDYILLLLKYKYNNFNYRFPNNIIKFEDLTKFVGDSLKNLINPDDLSEFFNHYSGKADYFGEISKDVKSISSEKFTITKDAFLYAIIDVYNVYMLAQSNDLKVLMKESHEISKESFVGLVKKLDPSLELTHITRVYEELVGEEGKKSSISEQDFIEVIMKYGIGGYGIGPFMTLQLRQILKQFLTKEKKSVKRRKSSDIIPYKITVNSFDDEQESKASIDLSEYEILPVKAARTSRHKNSRSPSPNPSPVSKAVIASKFFSSKRVTPSPPPE